MAKQIQSKRPITTDYGHSQGHCKTKGGSIKSVVRYLVDNGMRTANIEADGKRHNVYWNGYFGLTIAPEQDFKRGTVIPFKRRRA